MLLYRQLDVFGILHFHDAIPIIKKIDSFLENQKNTLGGIMTRNRPDTQGKITRKFPTIDLQKNASPTFS